MSTHPDFTKMNLALGGQICQALLARRVLFAYVEDKTGENSYLFVIGQDSNTMLDELEATPSFPAETAVYLVQLTEEVLREIQQVGVAYQGAAGVFDTSGERLGEVKTNGDFAISLRTEHGRQSTEVITADGIRKGDIFVTGDRNLSGEYHLYRALDTWQPFEDMSAHALTGDWDAIDQAARQALTKIGVMPSNVILFRLFTSSALLADLGVKDISK